MSNRERPNQHLDALVQGLLDAHGVPLGAHNVLRECRAPVSLSDIARALQRRGVSVRVVDILAPDLRQLGVTLVDSSEGLGLLRWPARSLELPDGRVTRGRRAIEAIIGSRALELEATWPTTGTLLGRYWQLCVRDPRLRAALFVLGTTLVASAGASLAHPALVSNIVDHAIPEGATSALTISAGALAAAAALGALVSNVSNRAAQVVEKRAATLGFSGIFAHGLSLELGDLQRQSTGKMLQVLRSLPALVRGTVHSAIDIGLDLLFAAVLLGWIARLVPTLAWLLLGLHLLLAVLLLPLSRRIARRQAQVQLEGAVQSDRLLELIEGLVALRAAGATEWAFGRWRSALASLQQSELDLELSTALASEVLGLTQRVAACAAVLWAAAAVLAGEGSLGELFVIMTLSSSANGAFARIILAASRALATRVQLALVDELLAKPATTDSRATRTPDPIGSMAVVVDGLWFRYMDHAPWVLRGYSASFPAGEVTTLHWPSGRGKSTLLRLIAGLHKPQRGAVTIKGIDAADARQLVTYVPQNCPLFSGSILRNLQLLSGAKHERIQLAAEATGLAQLTAEWPMGLETLVAAGATNLSSGQRQLVVLTAALASERPILLLDEATNHLDRIRRDSITGQELLAGRTVVNVTHLSAAIH